MKKKFDIRSFISFGLLFSFIIISLTGVVLYITPPGRVAKWVKWTLLGMEKEEWQAVHTIFSYFFLILGILHVFSLNRKVILAYIKKRAVSGINRKRELLASSLIVVFLFSGTLLKVQPLRGIMDIGEYFTESWENKDEAAPIPHTEAMTITELSKSLIELEPEKILKKLANMGIVADKYMTLKKIGELSGFSPLEIYQKISNEEDKKPVPDNLLRHGRGRGTGRKTIKEVSELFYVDPGKIIKSLKESGIESLEGDRIKDLAEKYDISPYELLEKIKKIKDKKEIK